MFVTRVEVELFCPIPYETMATSTRVVRRGRPVEIVESILSTETSPVARMIAVRIRQEALAFATSAIDIVHGVDAGDRAASAETSADAYDDAFHSWAVEHCLLRGPCDEPGRSTDWMRLKVPLLLDEPTSALCRVCAVADVGLGLSSEPPPGRAMGVPDLTVRLHRQPRGEWVGVDRTPDGGGGASRTRLFGRKGAIGQAQRNSLVDENRPSRSGDSWISTGESPRGDVDDLEPASSLVC
jgi:hypothetical protein